MTDRPDRPDRPAAELPELAIEELARYARHIVLPDVGEEGQRRLKAARVLVVGAGGLGSPVALYLAAAGVGTLGLVDFDRVDPTNLQRQVLHGTGDIGRLKIDSARETLRDLNPHVGVETHAARLSSANALELLAAYDLVVDGSDNFPTRYLVNDACVLLDKPNVYGSIFRWEGQVSLFAVPGGPCYRCLFREPPPPGLIPSCAEGGVFGALPGVVGSMQAVEAIKWIIGVGESLAGRLLIFDALDASWREVEVPRNPACPVCGDEPTQTELIDYEVFCGVAAPEEEGRAAGDAAAEGPAEIGARELAERLGGPGAPFLLDVRHDWEWRAGNLAGQGAVWIPEEEVGERLEELPRDKEIVVCCRVGARSRGVARELREAGFRPVRNLRGGLVAWRAQVDPDLTVA